MYKKISFILILLLIPYKYSYGEKLKKGVKIFVPLTIGSFEITSKRIKGGKIKKVGNSLEVSDIYVPTKKLKSGIDLRDEHMHERIRNKNVVVTNAKGKDGLGVGTIIVRDIEKEFNFKYEKVSDKYIKATFELNLTDFKIPDLSYAGVGVEDIIKLEVVLPYSN